MRVNCPFDKTEDTQLALMLPRERVQGEGGKGEEDGTWVGKAVGR